MRGRSRVQGSKGPDDAAQQVIQSGARLALPVTGITVLAQSADEREFQPRTAPDFGGCPHRLGDGYLLLHVTANQVNM